MAKRKKSRRSKKSMWKLAKGVVYTGAIAAPAYTGYLQSGGGAGGVAAVAKSMAFVNPTTGSFSLAHGAQMWTPVAAVALVDFATSKVGLQRKIASGINGLLG